MAETQMICIYCKVSKIRITDGELHYICPNCQSYFYINLKNPIYLEIYAYPEKNMRMHFEMQKIRIYFEKD